MTVICVDDEQSALQAAAALLKDIPGISETVCFKSPVEALAWLDHQRADLALLDIHMPEMDGLTMAGHIQDKYGDLPVIFITRDPQCAVDAFALHVSGYLLKPLDGVRLQAEVLHAMAGRPAQAPAAKRVTVQTFGNFDIKVDGKTVPFNRSKAKELLAYLVDRKGSSITRAEAFALLWEEGQYTRSMQKQLDVMIRSLRATLKEAGIPELMELRGGTMRIQPEMIDCDLYRFFEGDRETISSYRGEYMSAYSWASLTEAYLDRIIRERTEKYI